jgi:hypothetical protein
MTASQILEAAADLVETQGADPADAIVRAPPLEIGVGVDIEGAFITLREYIGWPVGHPLSAWIEATPADSQVTIMRRAAAHGRREP